jgi:hypothetical protein
LGARCGHDADGQLLTVTAMNAIEHALLALMAAKRGDGATAQGHISCAQRHARANARRERQVVEIAALVVGGDGERAAGLALEHTSEFPDDVDLLARVADCGR